MSLKKLRDFLKRSDINSWIREEVNEIAKVLCINGSSEDWAGAVRQIQENRSERNDYDHFQEFIEFTKKYYRRYDASFPRRSCSPLRSSLDMMRLDWRKGVAIACLFNAQILSNLFGRVDVYVYNVRTEN
ncbi:MAG: hypothetical protein LBD60_04095 [Puniceicoccales bacterium]|jgi:hypothetical protein|nr:hypothetical protein [Puniceicoccales bacterium]